MIIESFKTAVSDVCMIELLFGHVCGNVILSHQITLKWHGRLTGIQ